MSISCLRCSVILKPDIEKCAIRGSRDRFVKVEDSCQLLETAKVKQKAEGYPKFKIYSKHGEKVSKNGKLTRETLRIEIYYNIEPLSNELGKMQPKREMRVAWDDYFS